MSDLSATAALLENFPAIRAFIADIADSGHPPFEQSASKTGAPTGKLAGSWLHSRYDPLAEARKSAAETMAGGAGLVAVFGLGYGYLAEALLDAGCSVLAVEPCPLCLDAALRAGHLASLLSNPRFHLILGSGAEEFERALSSIDPPSLAALELPAYREAYAEEAARFHAVVDRFTEKDRINEATLKRFGRRWVRNVAANAGRLFECPGIAEYAGCLRGFPAVILAAGPSLDEVLPLLAALKERCVIVCVDTALRSALRAGVQPDFVVVVDPQYWNARHLDGCSSPSSILVTEAAVWPSVFRMPFRSRCLCTSLYPLGRYLESLAGKPKGILGAGGSVSTSAWDFARLLGCAPLYMAGLDLGFPRGHTHARASLFEQRSLAQGNRLAPSSHDLFCAMRGGVPFTAKANDGTALVSDKRLSLYAWWFSAKASRYPETQSCTLSSGGLAIPGLPLRSMEEILRLPIRRDGIDAAIASVLPAAGSGRDLDASMLNDALASLIRELDYMAALACEGRLMASDALAMSESQAAALLPELERIDGELLGSKAKEIVGFLFASIDDFIPGRARTLRDSLSSSLRLYGAIGESARWHADLLRSSC